MGKKIKQQESSAPEISKKSYKDSLHKLQIELVKLQRHFIQCDDKILIVFEGRDAAGKDGTIKRIVEHLSPRETRVVALGKPSDLARDEMLAHTHNAIAPWTIVRADDKQLARLNIIKNLLSRLHYAGKDERLILPDPDVVFMYDETYLKNGMIAE